jgi:hypothetical protein
MTTPAWIERLVVGAVIAERGGAWRVVRKVNRCRDGSVGSVTLTIRRCSWTGRCYTILNVQDLKQRGFRRIPTTPLKLQGAIDRKLTKVLRRHEDKPYSMTCCDVAGIP